MDEILLHLQKFKELRVRDRTSVEQYRGTTKTTRVIGKELGVEYLLEGSFQKVGDNVKLIVQLIEAKEERHTWANDYNRNWKDIFAVQSEVAQTIAKELYAKITPEENKLTEKIPTKNPAAYDLYLKANDYAGKYWSTRNVDYYQKAVTLYNAALEVDSTFARVYSSLAVNYFNRYVVEDFFKENLLDSCLVLANIALKHDDQLDEAYYIKGAYYQVNGNADEALDNYDKVIKINPNYSMAYYNKIEILWSKGDYVKSIENLHHLLNISSPDDYPIRLMFLGNLYMSSGFFDKAKYYYQEAFATDTNKKDYLHKLFMIEFLSENFDAALKLAEKLTEKDSTYLDGIIDGLFMYIYIPGHDKEAYILAKRYVEQFKTTPDTTSEQFNSYTELIGYTFWQVGKYDEAKYYFAQKIKYYEANIKPGRNLDPAIYYALAQTYAFLGDKLKAYQYLDEFNKSSYFNLETLIDARHNPLLEGMRNEERFQKIIQNMEARYQAEHERVRKWLEEQGKL
jgi:tetratricopeptide (TPR) repeat protein